MLSEWGCHELYLKHAGISTKARNSCPWTNHWRFASSVNKKFGVREIWKKGSSGVIFGDFGWLFSIYSYNKLLQMQGFKSHKFIILIQFIRSEVQPTSHWAMIKVSAGWCSWRLPSLASSASGGCLYPLGHSPISPSSKPGAEGWVLTSHCLDFPLSPSENPCDSIGPAWMISISDSLGQQPSF